MLLRKVPDCCLCLKIWSGDIYSTFEALRAQIPAGLNIAMTGIPWWTTDIGGFMEGDVRTDSFKELIVRWFQYGVFCPLFRLHGDREPTMPLTPQRTGGPNEVWSFGEQAYAVIRDLLFLRERLRPYVMELMREAHTDGTPVLRPLFFEFPDDPGAWAAEDEFCFGPDLLVAPVLEFGARTRSLYLPDGARWTDPWTGAQHQGGAMVTVQAPLDRIPVFLRDDAELPLLGDAR